MTSTGQPNSFPVDGPPEPPVTVSGAPDPEVAALARRRVLKSLRLAPDEVLAARVRLTRHRDCAVARPVIAQVNVDLAGRPVRVQVSGRTMTQAIDLMQRRLERRLRDAARNWEARRGWHWTSADGQERPELYNRAAEERRLVKRKVVTLRPCTVDEAADDLQLLDYDFFAFIEEGSAQQSVLYRAGDHRLHLVQVKPHPGLIVAGAVGVVLDPTPAPQLSITEATRRLDVSGETFVFYLRRGRSAPRVRAEILYRRCDGHYALITW